MRKKKLIRIPEVGSKFGYYNDIVEDIVNKITSRGSRIWIVLECSRCGKTYQGRLDSVMNGRRICKCRKEKPSVANSRKYL